MRMLVLGATGMLGHMACRVFASDLEVHASGRGLDRIAEPQRQAFENCTWHAAPDARDEGAMAALLGEVRPEVVLNCLGVVKQKAEARDAILSIRVNALLPHLIASVGDSFGGKLIQVGTDCVFSGRTGNYSETALPDPEDLYGRSKLLGEVTGEPHLTIRTSIIGRELTGQGSLLEWFRAQRGGSARGFARAIFSGLTTRGLCDVIGHVLREKPELHGLYHVATSPISKEDLLRMVNDRLGLGVEIERDESFVCDRSLNATKWVEATGRTLPMYDAMIDQLAGDEDFYA